MSVGPVRSVRSRRGRPRGVALAALALAFAAAGAPVRAQQGEAPGGAPPSIASEDGMLLEMGRFFEQSEPPSRDLDKARDLYCRAAALGNAEAIQRLGSMYLRGAGVPVGEQIAATLFHWAAALGDERAAGLGRALPMSVETPAPCLTRLGIHTLDALRSRVQASSRRTPAPAPAAGAPDASVDRPVQFRPGPAPLEYRQVVAHVVREARDFRLDPRLVLAVMRIESNFDTRARSPKNAQGLMQLIPETAARFNVRDPFDPIDNLRGGMAYLRWLLAYYQGDVALTLAAYNAGEGAVDRHRGVPPFAETIAYVQRIRALYPFDRHPFDVRALAAGERSWVGRGLVTVR